MVRKHKLATRAMAGVRKFKLGPRALNWRLLIQIEGQELGPGANGKDWGP